MKKNFKSIWAVVAGFLTVVVFSVFTDMMLEGVGLFPSQAHPEAYTTGLLFIALAYRTVYTVAGGYMTAKLAPSNPKKHVMILGIIGTLAGIGGVVAGWNISENWYPIALAALAYPSVWYGGKLFTDKKKKK